MKPAAQSWTRVFACICAMVLSGCASRQDGPVHEAYVPLIDMQGVDPRSYQADLSSCRTYVDGQERVPRAEAGRKHARGERIVMNCMVGRGYVVLDGPSVVPANFSSATNRAPASARADSTAVAATGGAVQRPKTVSAPDAGKAGKDRYQAELFARAAFCAPFPRAVLQSREPGREIYRVDCSGGSSILVQCAFGNCEQRGMPVMRSSL